MFLARVIGLEHEGGGQQIMGHACISDVCTAIMIALYCVLDVGQVTRKTDQRRISCTSKQEVHPFSATKKTLEQKKVKQNRERLRSALIALSCCWARSAAPLANALSLLIAAAFNVRTCKSQTSTVDLKNRVSDTQTDD